LEARSLRSAGRGFVFSTQRYLRRKCVSGAFLWPAIVGQLSCRRDRLPDVCFSNRSFGVKRFQAIGSELSQLSCCCCGLFSGPAELGAVNPDAVHDHGQSARQRHDRLLHPAAPGDLHRPGSSFGRVCSSSCFVRGTAWPSEKPFTPPSAVRAISSSVCRSPCSDFGLFIPIVLIFDLSSQWTGRLTRRRRIIGHLCCSIVRTPFVRRELQAPTCWWSCPELACWWSFPA